MSTFRAANFPATGKKLLQWRDETRLAFGAGDNHFLRHALFPAYCARINLDFFGLTKPCVPKRCNSPQGHKRFSKGLWREARSASLRANQSREAGLILFENVGFRYGRGPDVLHGLSFEIPEGAFSFVTGESGAGKSSLLRLLYLDDLPTAGRISLFGRDIATLTRDEVAWFRRRIGVVFQDFRLLDHLTAAENVALPLRVSGARPSAYRDNVAEMLQWVGLGDKMNVRPPQMSGGEKQRIAIARAVVASPDIILADEPTGSVDPAMAERIMQLFMEMNRLGKTVVLATHDVDMVARYDLPCLTLREGSASSELAA
ncbi:UNVERIFIED_CONTAM: hypothetical protein GTU68_003935 [Idotea baltica]|nr:hypothetical protein [Idotea baltica]